MRFRVDSAAILLHDMKPLIRAICVVLALGGLAAAAVGGVPLLGALEGDYDDVEPLEVHSQVAAAVVDRLREHHLIKAKPLDDRASEAIFERYLEFLDAKRLLLLASDVEEMAPYRTALDDALQQGDLEPAFEIYNVVRRRALDRVEFEVALLQQVWNSSTSTSTKPCRWTATKPRGQAPRRKPRTSGGWC